MNIIAKPTAGQITALGSISILIISINKINMIIASDDKNIRLSFNPIFFANAIGNNTEIYVSKAVNTKTNISLKNKAIHSETA